MEDPIRSPWQAAAWVGAALGSSQRHAERTHWHAEGSHAEDSEDVIEFDDASWAANSVYTPFTVEWSDTVLGRRLLHMSCAEQWFMLRKAWRFHDERAMRLILATPYDSARYRALGRSVHGLDHEVWAGHSSYFTSGACLYYMMETLLFKFSQNHELRQRLLATGERPLIYRSGSRVWGRRKDGAGENHLGFLLMDVRRVLRWESSAFDLKYGRVLSFLPALERADPSTLHEYHRPPSKDGSTISIGMTCHTDMVDDFNEAVQDTTWTREYLSLIEERDITMSTRPDKLDCSRMDDAEVQAALIFLMRQERFCDGLIAEALDHGMFVALLRRLDQLRDEPLDVPQP